MNRVKADQAQSLVQAFRSAFGSSGGGINTRASTMWKFFAWISAGDRIFHETLSMKAPNAVYVWILAGRKVDREIGIGGLSGFGGQMMGHHIVEHLPVHQDVEDGVAALLVDQRPGLEWLIEALLDHFHDQSRGHVLMQLAAFLRHQPFALGFHPDPVDRPFRRLQLDGSMTSSSCLKLSISSHSVGLSACACSMGLPSAGEFSAINVRQSKNRNRAGGCPIPRPPCQSGPASRFPGMVSPTSEFRT